MILRALLAAWLALVVSVSAQANAPAPTGDTGAHDPTLLVVGGQWFVFSTGRGVQRLLSVDEGQTWRRLAPVFEQAPAWWAEAVPGQKPLDVWAPKLFQHRGRAWLLYSISTFGKNRSAIGLASAERPEGPWRDEGLVLQSRPEDDFNAIDPDLFTDSDGRLWLSYGSFWGGIRLTALDAATLRPVGETRFIARRRAGGIEAPTIVRRGEWVYLFVSHDLCCKGVASSYNIRVGRSRSVTGPYLDRAGVDLMDGGGTLLRTGGPRWKGPGHQDVVIGAGGDHLVHHAYDAERNGAPHLRLVRLVWSADGWPVAGPDMQEE